jgi:TPR repeat protein
MRYFFSLSFLILFSTEALSVNYIKLYFDEKYELLLNSLGKEEAIQDRDYNFVLGMMYGNGKGVESNVKLAEKYLYKANELGQPEALVELGVILINTYGETEESMEKILPLFFEAANKGNRRAQSKISTFYFKGDWLKKDEKQAFKFASLAANQGYPFSMYYLGHFYEVGIGTQIDMEKSYYWFQKCSKIKYDLVQDTCLEEIKNSKWIKK